MKWTLVIVAGWMALTAAAFAQRALPASFWLDAGALRVFDDQVGDCPAMGFDREIARPFYAEWTVTIMRQTESGGFSTYLTYYGENDYRPENQLPDDLSLCWWTWSADLGVPFHEWRLELPDGQYRVNTLWKIYVSGVTSPKHVRRSSNVFRVGA